MFFTIDLFIDAIILLLHRNDPQVRGFVTKILDIYAQEAKEAVDEGTYFDLYVLILHHILDTNITIDKTVEIESLLLKIKSNPVVVKDPELYTNLKRIFTDTKPLTNEQEMTYLRLLANATLWHKSTTLVKRMFGKLANNAALKDPSQQERILTELNSMCSTIIQENQDTMNKLDEQTDETRITYLDTTDKESLAKALRVYNETIVGNTFKTGLQGLNRALGGGFRLGSSIVFNSVSHGGKAVRHGTLIKIPGGWKKIEDFKLGDQVIGRDGKPANVTGIYAQGYRTMYRVIFEDGRCIDTCGDHLWTVMTHAHNPDHGYATTEFVTNTRDIWEWYSRPENQGLKVTSRTLYVPLCEPEQNEDVELPIPPYVLGALLGDGHMKTHKNKKGRISNQLILCTDYDVIKRCMELLGAREEIDVHVAIDKQKKSPDYRVGHFKGELKVRLMAELKKLGVWNHTAYDKFIPDIYLNASYNQRLELIRGLMDTDGTVGTYESVNYDAVVNHCSFDTTSKQLARQVQYLFRSIGWMADYRPRITYYESHGVKKVGHESYVIRPIVNDFGELFYLPRKKQFAIPRKKIVRKQLRIRTVIKTNEKDLCTCIQVDNDDHLFVAKDFIVTHNSLSILKMLRWQVTYNSVNAQFPNPTCILYTLENETPQNLLQLFSEMYINKFKRLPPNNLTEEEIVNFCYDEFGRHGWKVVIDRRLGAEFGFPELVANFEEYVSLGFTPLMCCIDYMNMMRKGRDIADSGGTNALMVRELYTNICNYLKAHNCTLVTAHQLNRKALELARMNPMGVVKKFNADLLADSTDVQREVDVTIYQHKEPDNKGNVFLTFNVPKVRYNNDRPERDKYFAYAFHGPLGIVDDVDDVDRSTDNIYAYDYLKEDAKLYPEGRPMTESDRAYAAKHPDQAMAEQALQSGGYQGDVDIT